MGAVKVEKLAELSLDDGMMLHPVETDVDPFYISKEYIDKHKPYVGGYFVEYEDGYLSFSPVDAFESGYERIHDDEVKASPDPEADKVEIDKGEDLL